MFTEKEKKEYIQSQSRATGKITNDMLNCKDCIFRNDNMNTAYCNVYTKEKQRKPNHVLLGKRCIAYRQKHE